MHNFPLRTHNNINITEPIQSFNDRSEYILLPAALIRSNKMISDVEPYDLEETISQEGPGLSITLMQYLVPIRVKDILLFLQANRHFLYELQLTSHYQVNALKLRPNEFLWQKLELDQIYIQIHLSISNDLYGDRLWWQKVETV